MKAESWVDKMKKWVFEKHLPVYIRLQPTRYWLAIWCAPVRFEGEWRVNGEWSSVNRNDTYWQALRITVREGCMHSKLVFSIKEGVV